MSLLIIFTIFQYLFVFMLGASVGSFLNASYFRLENKINFSNQRSFCPNCKKKLSWYELIPIFSYLNLKGKCRNCGFSIPVHYFLFEVLFALALSGLFFLFQNTHNLNVLYFSITAVIFLNLVSIILTEFIYARIFIVNSLLIFLSALVLLISKNENVLILITIASVISFSLFLIFKIFDRARALLNDVILIFALTMILGPIELLFVIVLASFSGLIYALIRDSGRNQKLRIPIGAFISFVSLFILIFELIRNYFYG